MNGTCEKWGRSRGKCAIFPCHWKSHSSLAPPPHAGHTWLRDGIPFLNRDDQLPPLFCHLVRGSPWLYGGAGTAILEDGVGSQIVEVWDCRWLWMCSGTETALSSDQSRSASDGDAGPHRGTAPTNSWDRIASTVSIAFTFVQAAGVVSQVLISHSPNSCEQQSQHQQMNTPHHHHHHLSLMCSSSNKCMIER